MLFLLQRNLIAVWATLPAVAARFRPTLDFVSFGGKLGLLCVTFVTRPGVAGLMSVIDPN